MLQTVPATVQLGEQLNGLTDKIQNNAEPDIILTWFHYQMNRYLSSGGIWRDTNSLTDVCARVFHLNTRRKIHQNKLQQHKICSGWSTDRTQTIYTSYYSAKENFLKTGLICPLYQEHLGNQETIRPQNNQPRFTPIPKPLSHNWMIIQKEQIDRNNTNQKTKRNITTNITWLYTTIINYRTMKKNTHINHTGFCLHLRGFFPCNANLHTQTGIYNLI